MSDQEENYAAAGATNGGYPANDQGTGERLPAGGDRPGEIPEILWSAIDTLENAVEGLRDRLRSANQRASEAQARADRERNRADQAEQRVAELLAQRRRASRPFLGRRK